MDGVPLVVTVVVIDLNSFTESDRVVVAPGIVDAVLETIVGDNINGGDETDTVEDDAVVADTVVGVGEVEGDDSDDTDTVVADDDVDSDDAEADVAFSAVAVSAVAVSAVAVSAVADADAAVADAANSGAAVADDVVADSDVVAISNFAMVDVEGSFVVENVVLHISSYSFLIFFSRSSSCGLHRAHFVKYEVLACLTMHIQASNKQDFYR